MNDDVIERARRYLDGNVGENMRSDVAAELCTALLAADERARALAEDARVEEREACARICDVYAEHTSPVRARVLASLIRDRARGQAKADAGGGEG